MSKTPKFDAKIKEILDQTTPGPRVCSISGKEWKLEADEIDWCRKFNVPPSSIHPLTRMRMLMASNTGLALWWKKHAKTGEPILSVTHPDNPIKVIKDKEWFDLDNISHGRDVQPDVLFFDQLFRLYLEVPYRALSDPGNSENTIGITPFECRDSYMVFGTLRANRCSYVHGSTMVEDSVDVTSSLGGVQDSWSINRSRSLHNCHFAMECHDCLNSWFLFDCRNCEFCFGATNQRNKKYLWFNEQLSKEEWEKRFDDLDLSCSSIAEEQRQKFLKLVEAAAWPENFNIAALDSTGEYLEDTVRVRKGYNLQKAVDCLRTWYAIEIENCAYVSGAGFSSEIWCSSGAGYCQGMKYSRSNTQSQGLEYCFKCVNCIECFGCVGLSKKRFCILNKQYSEEEYYKKLDELKCAMLDRGEYGELLPAKINNVGAQFSAGSLFDDYDVEEVRNWGGEVYDEKRGTMYMPDRLAELAPLPAENLPDCLHDAGDEYTRRPILDKELGRSYAIHPQELAFYHKHKLPLPRKHFLSRLTELVRYSNSPVIEKTVCGECGKEDIAHNINLTFKKNQVLCKGCYLSYLEAR